MSRTKDLMIDVARQLFAKLGVEKTTMNDIADAANRGRRTLYTYFRSKEDIYKAVIEKELKTLYANLEAAAQLSLTPSMKLMHFISTHLEAIKELVLRNGSLRADFFQNIKEVEMERRHFDRKEMLLIKQILDEGVSKGVFVVPDTSITATILLHSCKGLEVPYISGHIRNAGSAEFEKIRQSVHHLIFNGIMLQSPNSSLIGQ